jgi:hypothetical protein
VAWLCDSGTCGARHDAHGEKRMPGGACLTWTAARKTVGPGGDQPN